MRHDKKQTQRPRPSTNVQDLNRPSDDFYAANSATELVNILLRETRTS